MPPVKSVERRWKNANWLVADEAGNLRPDAAIVAVLMDLRDELRFMNVSLANLNQRVIETRACARAISRKIPTRRKLKR